ncbi:MAG: response regulator transcription factor [Tannerella sp.]|jgi:DNA-binding NarL/FixJ family response regulator|nr:response regulator transcription factor [Tannerella sp.]
MITVHITDDHKILTEGLSILINESGTALVNGISHSLAECRSAFSFNRPDVLLLDIQLPDGSGIDFCKEMRAKYPELKILALTTHNEYSIVRRMMDNGAHGYILKNSLSEEILAGIETVMNDEIFLCEDVDILIKKQDKKNIWLTTREQELLRHLVNGCTNQELSDKLFLGVETIKTYRKNLILKLGAKNSIVLVKMALEDKLI